MKAMIFAAGKGSRLKPITDNIPKALVPVNGIPMIERIILKLKDFGIKDIIINTHYLGNQIIDFLKTNKNFGLNIECSNETPDLLNTGGGLKKASYFFNDQQPFILYNTDIISDIDLGKMLETHKSNKAIATLAVRARNSSRYFLFNKNNELCGWRNEKTKKQIITSNTVQLKKLAFSGIHIISPELFDFFKPEKIFSIVDTYLDISNKQKIIAYEHSNDHWFDIGDTNKLKQAENFFAKNK